MTMVTFCSRPSNISSMSYHYLTEYDRYVCASMEIRVTGTCLADV